MISSINGSGLQANYYRSSRPLESNPETQPREAVALQLRTVAANGGTKKDLETIVAKAGAFRYSEEDLVADEMAIQAREDLKNRIRAGISDPIEALKAKGALLTPLSWPEDSQLEVAQQWEADGRLDQLIKDRLEEPRGPSKRELQDTWVSAADRSQVDLNWTPEHAELWKRSKDGTGWVIAVSEEELIRRGFLVKPTAEMKAELAARDANVAPAAAETRAQREANPGLYSNNLENNTMYEANILSIEDEEVRPRIEYIRNLIQSGEAAKYTFRSWNGDTPTDSIHQFLYWLQERDKELQSDGTYSPEMFK